MDIDYHVTPTFAKIHTDKNPFIFVMGPVRPMSCDTEVLTPSGWCRLDAWKKGTPIAQYNILDRALTFYYPEDITINPCNEFIHFSNDNSLSMKLSPAHNILTYDYNNNIKVLTAEELEKHPSKHTIPTTFINQPMTELAMSDDMIRLWVAVAADGHYPNKGNQCTFSLRKDRKKERLVNLLDTLNIKFTEVQHKSRPTESIFTFERPEFPKHLDRRLYGANSKQLKVVADECSKWDGTEIGTTFRYTTSIKEQANIIQFACHASGYRASISTKEYINTNWKHTFIVSIAKSAAKSKVMVRKDCTSIVRVPSEDGKEYCFASETGFLLARHNDKIFITGNSGKSSGCVWHCFLNACKQKPDANGIRHSRYLIIRATYPSLTSTTLKTWISWFKDKIKITYTTPIRAEIKYDLSDGTSLNMEVLFLAVASAQDVEKLRSLEVTGCHINEAKEIDRDIFQMVKTRIGHFPAQKDGGAIDPFILSDYNAVATDHWLYKIAEEDRPVGHSFYRQPPAVIFAGGKYFINPEAENLTRIVSDGSEIKGVDPDLYLMMCMGNDPDFVYVNVMNNYGEVRSGKPVYKDYNDADHCASKELIAAQGSQLIIGMDQGLTPAAAICQQQPDGKILVLDEITTTDCSLQEFCNDLLWPLIKSKYPAFEKNFYVVCDPATAQRSMNDSKAGTDIIKESGLPFRTAKTNSFTARREAVVHFLRLSNKFQLSPNCRNLRKGFLSEYKYEETRSSQTGEFKDKPSKNEFSHVQDALQYAILEFYHLKDRKRPKINRNKYKSGSEIGGY